MSASIDPQGRQPIGAAAPVDAMALFGLYLHLRPDPAVAARRATFGASGQPVVWLQSGPRPGRSLMARRRAAR